MDPATLLIIAQAIATIFPTIKGIVDVVDTVRAGKAPTDEQIAAIKTASQATDPAAFEALAKAAGLPWPPAQGSS